MVEIPEPPIENPQRLLAFIPSQNLEKLLTVIETVGKHPQKCVVAAEYCQPHRINNLAIVKVCTVINIQRSEDIDG